MLTMVPGPIIQSYSGELKKKGDKREAQVRKILNVLTTVLLFCFPVLYEYDSVYKILYDKGLESGLDLPPLMLQAFVDHGAVTTLNKNCGDVQKNVQLVLQFIESTKMYDILVPAPRGYKGQEGYKINSNDSRLPSEIKAALTFCAATFISTLDGKSVRLRFLDIKDLDEGVAKKLKVKVLDCQNSYQKCALRAIKKIARDQNSLATEFKEYFKEIVSARYVVLQYNSKYLYETKRHFKNL